MYNPDNYLAQGVGTGHLFSSASRVLSAFFSDLAVSILPMLIADIESRRRFLTPSEEVHIARATLPYSFTLMSSHRIVEIS